MSIFVANLIIRLAKCHGTDRFHPVYADGMPNRIPLKVFLKKAYLEIIRQSSTFMRIAVAYTVYSLILPYLCIGGLRIHTAFAEALPSHPSWFFDLRKIMEFAFTRADIRKSARMTVPFDLDYFIKNKWYQNIILDVFQGQELLVFSILLMFIVMMVREWILQNELFLLQLRQMAEQDRRAHQDVAAEIINMMDLNANNQLGRAAPAANAPEFGQNAIIQPEILAQMAHDRPQPDQDNPALITQTRRIREEIQTHIDLYGNYPNSTELGDLIAYVLGGRDHPQYQNFFNSYLNADGQFMAGNEGAEQNRNDAPVAPERVQPILARQNDALEQNDRLFQFVQQMEEDDRQQARNAENADDDAPIEEFDGLLDFLGWNRPIISLVKIGLMGSVLFFMVNIVLYFVPYVIGRLTLSLFGLTIVPLAIFASSLLYHSSIIATGWLINGFKDILEICNLDAADYLSIETTLSKALAARQAIAQLSAEYSESGFLSKVWVIPDSGFLIRLGGLMTGYAYIMVLVAIYIKSNYRFGRSRSGKEIEKAVLSVIMQLQAILKVICIIGIELVIFPIFCGTLLHLSLLPLMESATFLDRVKFTIEMPVTSTLIHWIIGTAYMFVFALFVSLCRKIMRPGVLYFVRDPNDPNFHPIKDVLERPLLSQLGKIGISGIIYSILITVCLGGVLFIFRHVLHVSFLPLKFSMDFPEIAYLDLIQVTGPFAIMLFRCYRMVSSLSLLRTVWSWWFEWACSMLRLSSFILNRPYTDEQGSIYYTNIWARLTMVSPDYTKPVSLEDAMKGEGGKAYYVKDGTYVRAPDVDSLSTNSSMKLFIPVDKHDIRQDGKEDREDATDELKQYDIVYRPPHFRMRIAAFLLCIWAFGIVVTTTLALLPLYSGKVVAAAIFGFENSAKLSSWIIMYLGIPVATLTLYAIDRWHDLATTVVNGWKELNRHEPVQATGNGEQEGGGNENLRQAPSNGVFKFLFFVAYSLLVMPYFVGSTLIAYRYKPGWNELPMPADVVIDDKPNVIDQLYPTFKLAAAGDIGLISDKSIIHAWLIGLGIVFYGREFVLFFFSNSQIAQKYKAMTQNGFLRYDYSIFTENFVFPFTRDLFIFRVLPYLLRLTVNAVFVNYRGMNMTIERSMTIEALCYTAVKLVIVLAGVTRVWFKMFTKFLRSARDEEYLVGERLENQ